MDKEFVSTYLRFLSQASEAELMRERARLQALVGFLREADARSDLKWMMRKVMAELMNRAEADAVDRNRRRTR